jgi:hypothetical protein
MVRRGMRGLRTTGVAAGIALVLLPVLPASAAKPVSVKRGVHYGARIFPDNAFTVRDRKQATGRRVHFRKGVDYPLVGRKIKRACTSATYSICDGFAQLNKLDGFDLQPRVVVPFSGPIKLDSVGDKNFFISDGKNKLVSGMRQLTFDPATNTLAGISDKFLVEGTTYRIHVTSGIRDSHGKAVKACKRSCTVRFTTRTASGELVRIRKSMDLPPTDPASAYKLAGIPDVAARKLTFTQDG